MSKKAKGEAKGGGQRGAKGWRQRRRPKEKAQGEAKGEAKEGPPSHTCYHLASQRKQTGKSKTFNQMGAMTQCPPK